MNAECSVHINTNGTSCCVSVADLNDDTENYSNFESVNNGFEQSITIKQHKRLYIRFMSNETWH